ncbi:uncharacterized protein LOC124867405 isoform X2 [Girardinichthys multiradiatus]|uniref:uncharacterized protein LOC124867405 isoform X2 n=1 Tax=Girardinichthys multiradiatus TaxID=208333 RepID=UPI001FAC2A41|nr:uncharacterized protein LOC124867405 isoform X2 [Girardinichthys multiradiatus]
MAGIPVQSFHNNSRQKKGQGKLILSRAEQMLMAIVDNSEVEDLSNGEECDPAVDEYIPAFDPLPDDSEDDYSPPDSPEDDSDDYTPSDAAEANHYNSNDSDSENRSELPQSQARKRKRKQQHGELESYPRNEPPNAGCRDRWKSAPFTPDLIQFQGEDDSLKNDWQPQDYVEHYIDSELMKLVADCTNAMSLAKSGRSFNTSFDEIYHCFGAAILMSCVHYQQTRMFW